MPACWPRAEELAFEPELASLALLDAAIAISIQALIARNPELLLTGDGESLRPVPQLSAARTLIAVFRDVHIAVQRYRDLSPPPSAPGDDLPF